MTGDDNSSAGPKPIDYLDDKYQLRQRQQSFAGLASDIFILCSDFYAARRTTDADAQRCFEKLKQHYSYMLKLLSKQPALATADALSVLCAIFNVDYPHIRKDIKQDLDRLSVGVVRHIVKISSVLSEEERGRFSALINQKTQSYHIKAASSEPMPGANEGMGERVQNAEKNAETKPATALQQSDVSLSSPEDKTEGDVQQEQADVEPALLSSDAFSEAEQEKETTSVRRRRPSPLRNRGIVFQEKETSWRKAQALMRAASKSKFSEKEAARSGGETQRRTRITDIRECPYFSNEQNQVQLDLLSARHLTSPLSLAQDIVGWVVVKQEIEGFRYRPVAIHTMLENISKLLKNNNNSKYLLQMFADYMADLSVRPPGPAQRPMTLAVEGDFGSRPDDTVR